MSKVYLLVYWSEECYTTNVNKYSTKEEAEEAINNLNEDDEVHIVMCGDILGAKPVEKVTKWELVG